MVAERHAEAAPVALFRIDHQVFIDDGNGTIGAGLHTSEAFPAGIRVNAGSIRPISGDLAGSDDLIHGASAEIGNGLIPLGFHPAGDLPEPALDDLMPIDDDRRAYLDGSGSAKNIRDNIFMGANTGSPDDWNFKVGL